MVLPVKLVENINCTITLHNEKEIIAGIELLDNELFRPVKPSTKFAHNVAEEELIVVAVLRQTRLHGTQTLWRQELTTPLGFSPLFHFLLIDEV